MIILFLNISDVENSFNDTTDYAVSKHYFQCISRIYVAKEQSSEMNAVTDSPGLQNLV